MWSADRASLSWMDICTWSSPAASPKTRTQVAVSSSSTLASSASGLEQYGQPSGQRWVSSASRPSGLCTIAEPDNATGRLIHCSVRGPIGTRAGPGSLAIHARLGLLAQSQTSGTSPLNDDLYPDSKSFYRPNHAPLRDDFLRGAARKAP